MWVNSVYSLFSLWFLFLLRACVASRMKAKSRASLARIQSIYIHARVMFTFCVRASYVRQKSCVVKPAAKSAENTAESEAIACKCSTYWCNTKNTSQTETRRESWDVFVFAARVQGHNNTRKRLSLSLSLWPALGVQIVSGQKVDNAR